MQNDSWLQFALYTLILVVVLTLRIRRMRTMRRLRLETLWIMPAIFFAVFGFIFYEVPPHGISWLWCAVAFAVGSCVGWYRGRLVEISVDPETHELNQKSSPGAVIFIVALLAIRFATKSVVDLETSQWHLDALLVSAIFISGAAGTLAAFRLELFVRARRLLETARRQWPRSGTPC